MSGESESRNWRTAELIAVARIVKTRGVRGELSADLLTDFPERFDGLKNLIAVSPQGERTLLEIEDCWLHGRRLVVKFKGYDAPETAQALVGFELTVPESDAVELGEDEYYDWQLMGCRVELIDGTPLGTVARVEHYGAAPVLFVRDEARGREHLLPLAKSICVEIDVSGKLIRVDPPEGLVEL